MSSRRIFTILAAGPAAVMVAMAILVGAVLGDGEAAAPAAAAAVVVHPAAAKMPAAFDAGNIISDELFYDTTAMDAAQLGAFINTQGTDCTGDWCLKNLRINAPAQPADAYCQGYPGATDEDAAAVIVAVSVACGINPQVMIVTLEKESGLVSTDTANGRRWDAAWGWHCPDTGPGGTANCDPAHGGFFNQLYGMAKQWARYRTDPGKYNYHAGQTAKILWNVQETGCGAGTVTIKNIATASLYNYTPYQPNAASLAAYPGQGDRCSSYGNRNFYFLFVRYFGHSTTEADPPPGQPGGGVAVTLPNKPDVVAEVRGKTIAAPTAGVAKGIRAGLAYLGYPYVWGGGGDGAGPNDGCGRGGGSENSCQNLLGFDCSGLTAFVLVQGGYHSPGGSSGEQRASGTDIPYTDGLPGDIVGFPGHVAIYLGEIGGTPYILQASRVGTPIQVVPLRRQDRDAVLHRHWTR